MLLCAFALLSQGPAPDLMQQLEKLAQARDVAGLAKYLAPYKGMNPFNPIKTGGPYDTGRFGWKPILLRMLTENFVVFTTQLTSEDIGELLFRFNAEGKLEYIPEDFANGERIASHDFAVSFDLANKKALIKDTIELQMVDRRVYAPMIRIGPNYRVSKITNAAGQPVAFLQAGGIICFPGLSANEKLTLTYAGIVDKPGFAGSISEKEAMLTNDYWWPMVARMPAPYKATITIPKTWTAVAQGEMEGEEVSATTKKVRYRMDLPVSYYSLSAAPYQVVQSKSNGRTYRMWSNELSETQMSLQNEIYPGIIDFYDRIAPYPFTGWGAVVSRAYGGGALEAYSFATYGGGMPGEDGHETGHTWFGGMISNTYLHSLWNESFAVFCDGYYHRNAPIGNLAERRLAYIDTPSTPASYNTAPVATASPFIGPDSSSLGYGKGGFVLQMLEQEIGSERMLNCMKEWQRVHPKTQGGEWSDFEAAVARVPGPEMTWFFDQWLRKTGWVDFDVQDLKWMNNRLVGKVVFKSDPYIVHSEILIRDVNGKESAGTVILSDNLRDKEQRFVVACPTKPSLVSFDPWRRILRPIHADEAPVELSGTLRSMKRYTDPQHKDYLRGIGSGSLDALPADLAGTFVVGHPDSLPALKSLCAKAGFQVSGGKLTYKGTEIDLTKGGAMSVVDLGGGKSCVIGLGKTRVRPNLGRTKTIVFDDLGRFLRGETLPKTSGYLTFKDF